MQIGEVLLMTKRTASGPTAAVGRLAVVVLDEPGAHLDVGHQLRLFRVLYAVRGTGVAVLAVVHDLARAAARAERMLLLHGGTLPADAEPAQLLAGEACARALAVTVTSHAVPGHARPLWSFEER
jgi:iron complex transport system ATP-binding protein